MDMQQYSRPQHKHTEHHKAQNFSTGGRTEDGYHSSKHISTEDEEECYRSGPAEQGDDCNISSKYGHGQLEGGHNDAVSSYQPSGEGGFGGFGGFGQRQQHQHQHQQQTEPRSEQQQLEQSEPEYRQQPPSQHKHEHEPEPQHYEQHQHTPGHHHDASYTSTDAPDRGQDYTHKEVAYEDKDIDEGRQQQAARNNSERSRQQEPMYVQPSSNERSSYEQPSSDERSTYEQPRSTAADSDRSDYGQHRTGTNETTRSITEGRQAGSDQRSTYEQPRTGGHADSEPRTGSYEQPQSNERSTYEQPRTGSYEQPQSNRGSTYDEPRTGGYSDSEPHSDEGYDRSQAGNGQQGQTTGSSAQAPATGGIWSYVPGTQAWSDAAEANRQRAQAE